MKSLRTLAALAAACSGPSLLASDQPDWWTEYGVTFQQPANNQGPANLGQLKWMAHSAWYAKDEHVPGGAGFLLESVIPPVPANPDSSWYEAQRKVVNLGQLKHVAAPFYERLNLLAPGWVVEEFDRNGLGPWPNSVPWNPATPVSQNFSPANIGQLKLVFSLRFDESHDGDAIPDLIEHMFYGTTAGDGTTTDYDRDGVSDAQEFALGTSPFLMDSNGDGIPDGASVPSYTPPVASGLVVWTSLEN